MLDVLAFGCLGLGDELTERPQGLCLGEALRNHRVRGDAVLERTGEQAFEARERAGFVLVIGDLDEHAIGAARAAALERIAVARKVPLDQFEGQIADQFERGQGRTEGAVRSFQQRERLAR